MGAHKLGEGVFVLDQRIIEDADPDPEKDISESDYRLLLELAQRMEQAKDTGQKNRLLYFIKGFQNIVRVLYNVEPDEKDRDHIDRKLLDEMTEYFEGDSASD